MQKLDARVRSLPDPPQETNFRRVEAGIVLPFLTCPSIIILVSPSSVLGDYLERLSKMNFFIKD